MATNARANFGGGWDAQGPAWAPRLRSSSADHSWRDLVTVFAMAFASMTYELILAQCTTVLYGGSVLRYSVVMGLFIFSLGMGAAYWATSERPVSLMTFWRLELVLALAGLSVPLLVFCADRWALSLVPAGATAPIVGLYVALGLAMAVGWLSGMELPVVLLLARERRVACQAAASGRELLALDFLGTVGATILVPLVLVPALGITGSVAVAVVVNASSGWLFCQEVRSASRLLPLLTIATLVAGVLLLSWRDEVGQWLALKAF